MVGEDKIVSSLSRALKVVEIEGYTVCVAETWWHPMKGRSVEARRSSLWGKRETRN